MSKGEATVLLCAIAIGLAIGTVIGAVFLRAAVNLYNKLAGGASSPDSVPRPTFGQAMWISFATCLAQMVAGFLMGGFPDARAPLPRADEKGLNVDGLLISVLVGFLIQAAILAAKLPTTFGRAIVVTLCDLLIVLFVAGVIAVILVIVFALA